MATSTPQSPSQTAADSAQLLHNLSVAAIVVCPLLIALPPRKFDFYTITLLSGTFLGTNQLAHEYTGRSLVVRLQDVPVGMQAASLKYRDSRKEVSETVVENYDAQMLGKFNVGVEEKKGGVLDALRRKEEDGGPGRPHWKEERDKREREAAEEGKGIADLIVDQIWEVVNWGKGDEKDAALKEAEEKLKEEQDKITREKAAQAERGRSIMNQIRGAWNWTTGKPTAKENPTTKDEKKR